MIVRHQRCTGLLVGLLICAGALASPGRADDAPAGESGKMKAPTVLVFDLEESSAAPGLAKTIGGLITTTIDEKSELQVLSGQDIRRAMELSAEQAAVGCTDDTSCLVEVADALGATYVIFGDVGKLGSTLIVQLSVLNSQKGVVVSRQAIRADSEESLIDQVPAGTASLMNPVLEAEGLALMEGLELKDLSANKRVVVEQAPPNVPAIALAGGGAAMTALGVVGALGSSIPYGLYAWDSMSLSALEDGVDGPVDRATLEKAHALQESRALNLAIHEQWTMWGMVGMGAFAGVGAATLGAGLVWLALPSGDDADATAEGAE